MTGKILSACCRCGGFMLVPRTGNPRRDDMALKDELIHSDVETCRKNSMIKKRIEWLERNGGAEHGYGPENG